MLFFKRLVCCPKNGGGGWRESSFMFHSRTNFSIKNKLFLKQSVMYSARAGGCRETFLSAVVVIWKDG